MTAQLPSFYGKGNINLRGEKGDKGDPGPQGPAGPQGPEGPPGGATVDPEVLARLATVEANYVDSDGVSGIASAIANAKVAQEASARADAISAEATARTTLAATLRTETEQKFGNEVIERNAAITAASNALATADGALSTRIGTIEADYTKRSDVDTKVAAKVAEEATARADAVSAVASRVSTIETTYITGTAVDTKIAAKVADETTARTSAIAAEASRVDGLLTQYIKPAGVDAKITAAINTEQTARASAIAAEATRVDTLLASYTPTTGVDSKISSAITTEQTARANAIGAEASRVDNLLTQYIKPTDVDSKITAAISTERTVRVGAEGALSTRIDTTNSRIGDVEARTSITETSITGLQGKAASRIVLQSVAGNGRAQVSIWADANSGGGVDIVGDVGIHGNLVVAGTFTASRFAPDAGVDLGAVVPGALNTSVSATQGSDINLPVTLNAPNTSGPNGDGTQAIVTSPAISVISSGDTILVGGSVTVTAPTNRGQIMLQRSVNGGGWVTLQEVSPTTSQLVPNGTYVFSYENLSHSGGSTLSFRLRAEQMAAQGTGDGSAGTNWTITGASIKVRRFFSK